MAAPRAGAVVGILTFLAGIGLLVATFAIAYSMFTTQPQRVLNMSPNAPLNLNDTSQQLINAVLRVLLLLIMCIVGSSMASRGIRLYAAGGEVEQPHAERP